MQPLLTLYRSVKIKKQNDINECGLVVVQSLHREYYSKEIDINELKRKSNMSDKGISIANLILLAEKYGIEMDAFKGTADQFLDADLKGYFACIFDNQGMNHYVIFKKLGKRILVFDPVKGRYLLSRKKFTKLFSGIIFGIAKGEYKIKEPKKPNLFRMLLRSPAIITTLIILILVNITTTFAASIFMKIIIDTIIPGGLDSQLLVISLIFVWVAVLSVTAKLFKSLFSKKLTLRIETELTSRYFRRIRDASVIDLEKINTSDHLRRISLIESSAAFMSNIFMSIFGEVVTLIVSSAIMIWINMNLFLIASVAGATIIITTFIFNLFIKQKYGGVLNTQLDFLTHSIDQVMSLKELKEPIVAKTQERHHLRKYNNYKSSEYSLWKLDIGLSSLNGLLVSIAPILLVFISTKLIFTNSLSVGSMIMFVSIFRSFINPLESVSHMFTKIPMAKKNIKMISYVLELDAEQEEENKKQLIKIEELEMNNISFGYDRTLFKIKKYKFDRNIHISGKNGSGKSSLLNLISFRYEPIGELKVNKLDSKVFNKKDLRSKVFLATPSTYIHTTSIYEYITLGDKVAMEVFNANMVNYNLHSLLNDMGLSFQQEMVQNGMNLSSGQRQMIILLRLFAFGYDLILLDEATENIDAKKVKWLSKAIDEVQDGIFIEVSHSQKYLAKGKKVKIDEIFESA